MLCSERGAVLKGIVEYYGVVDSPALGKTARDVAKDLPIRLLHGGSHAAWLAAHGLMEEHPMLPLMARLERAAARLPARGLPAHGAARRGMADGG